MLSAKYLDPNADRLHFPYKVDGKLFAYPVRRQLSPYKQGRYVPGNCPCRSREDGNAWRLCSSVVPWFIPLKKGSRTSTVLNSGYNSILCETSRALSILLFEEK